MTTQEGNKELIEAKLASHRGYQANLTRKLNTADRVLAQANTLGASNTLKDQLEDCQRLLQIAFDKVEDSFHALQAVDDPKQFQVYEDKIDNELIRIQKTREALTEMIANFELELAPRPTTRAAGPATAGGHRPKPNEALKPKPLSRDSNPVELTAWIEQFTAYFVSSRLEEATFVELHAHFRACLDAYLNSRLHPLAQPNTPVLEDPANVTKCCVELLRDEFLIQHPLFSRRLDFFNFKQSSGQAFSDWYQKLKKKGDVADFACHSTISTL